MARNQCDGCQAGRPIDENGFHSMSNGSAYPDRMVCQKEAYKHEPGCKYWSGLCKCQTPDPRCQCKAMLEVGLDLPCAHCEAQLLDELEDGEEDDLS